VSQKPSNEPELPQAARRFAAFALLRVAQGWLTLIAVFILTFAAVALTLAWHIGPEVALRHAQYAKLTGHAQARIVDSWLALDVDLPTIKSADFWRSSAYATPCVVVNIEGEWSEARERAFCGNRFQFHDSYDVPFLSELAPGVPFSWPRDERGFAVPQIRTSSAALDWLAKHPVDTFMHRQWPAKSALDWLKIELDRPIDAAIAGWSGPAPSLVTVYDPANPAVLLPEGLVRARQAVSASWFFAAFIFAFGLALWIGGMLLLPALTSFNAVGRVVLIVLPLLALPWWADYMPRALRWFNADVGEFAGEIMGDVDPLDRFAAVAPADAAQAGGERLTWPAGGGPYADTFGRLSFAKPSHPMPADAALAALAASATSEIARMDEAERIELFDNLRRDKRLDLQQAGLVMLPAARDVLVGPAPSPQLRRAARLFLTDWVTAPTLPVDPHLPAYDARVKLIAALGDVPVPEIANMVRR